MVGNSLNHINNRLTSRLTYCDWDRQLMGPIYDKQGLEQGGCNSSDEYKIYNNDLLKIVQQSNQGVDLGNGLVITGLGQADDIAIVSNSIRSLHNALNLALNYCQRFHVELCSEKNKTSHVDQIWRGSICTLQPHQNQRERNWLLYIGRTCGCAEIFYWKQP